jgi:hypothetical protein
MVWGDFRTEDSVSMADIARRQRTLTLPRPCSSALLVLIVDDLGGGVERPFLAAIGSPLGCASHLTLKRASTVFKERDHIAERVPVAAFAAEAHRS